MSPSIQLLKDRYLKKYQRKSKSLYRYRVGVSYRSYERPTYRY